MSDDALRSSHRTDRLLALKRPEITENYQFEVVESRNQTVQDVINGMILALIVLGPIALIMPSPI